MNQTIEISIVDVLTRLEGKIDKLDSKIDQVEQRLETKIDQVEQRLETKIDKLDGKIDTLNEEVSAIRVDLGKLGEKTTGLETRLGILEFVYRGVGIAIIGAILLSTLKFLFPNLFL